MTSPKPAPEPVDPYELSDYAKGYVPELSEIARLERWLEGRSGVAFTVSAPLTKTEADLKLADEIVATEQRLITYRYIQKIRAERAVNPSWLRRALGWLA